jgi:PAS domain S-box-containing protein
MLSSIRKLFFTLTVLLSVLFINSENSAQKQNPVKGKETPKTPIQIIEDLKIKVSKVNEDTSKVNLLNEIAEKMLPISQDSSLIYANQGLTLSEKLNWDLGKAKSYLSIGNIFFGMKKYEISKLNFDKSLEIYQKTNNQEGIGNCNLGLGNFFTLKKDFDKAANCYNKAIEIFKKEKNINLETKAYLNYGTYFNKQNKKDSALIVSKKALSLAEKNANTNNIITARIEIGNIYSNLSDYINALENYQEGLEIAEDTDDLDKQARILNNMGIIFDIRADYQKALDFYSSSLSISEKLGNKKSIALKLGNIAVVYTTLSEFKKALEYLEKAIKISEELNDKNNLLHLYGNIANIYDDLHKPLIALEYNEKALKISEELEIKSSIAMNLGNIGIIYSDIGNYPKALEYLEKAIYIANEIGDKQTVSTNSLNIGNVYDKLSNNNKALEYFQKALEISESIGSLKNISACYSAIGNQYYIMAVDSNLKDTTGRFEKLNKAVYYLEKSVDGFKERNELNDLRKTLLMLTNTYLNLGNFQKVYEKFNEATIIKDSIFTLETNKKIAELEAIKDLEKKNDENLLLQLNTTMQDIDISRRNEQLSLLKSKQIIQALELDKRKLEINRQVNELTSLEKDKKLKELLLKEKEFEQKKSQNEIDLLNKEKAHQGVIRNFLIGMSIFGLFITLLIIFFYRRKKKDNKLLEEKNSQINNANIELENLNEDLVKTNRIIEQKNEQLSILINNLPALIFFKDVNLKYITVNELYTIALRKEQGEIIGFSDEEMNDPEYEEHKKVDLEIIANKQTVLNIEKQYENQQGEKYWISTTKVPYCDENGNVVGIIGIVQNITYFKITEEKLKGLNNSLEKHSEHLESVVAERTQELVVAMQEIEKASKLKTEIIANMNHEIRTPLNFIKGAAALIKMSVPNDSSDSELVDYIVCLDEGVSRLTRTLELFADLSSIKSGNYMPIISPFNLSSILDHYFLMYSKRISEIQKPIEINLSCQIDEAYIEADEQNTQKTIEFIIDNAVKFTDAGQVIIKLSEIDDSKYQLIIEDTGVGIDDEYKERIFEPFSQEDMSATRAYEGIGLSLALAYEYSLVNKFNMSFESEKGKGTKFVLEFDKYDIDEMEL